MDNLDILHVVKEHDGVSTKLARTIIDLRAKLEEAERIRDGWIHVREGLPVGQFNAMSSRVIFAFLRGALWGNLFVTIVWIAYEWWQQ